MSFLLCVTLTVVENKANDHLKTDLRSCKLTLRYKHNKHCSTLHTLLFFHESVIQRRDLFQLTLADAHCFYYGSLETLDFLCPLHIQLSLARKILVEATINYCSLLLFSAALCETTAENAFLGYWNGVQSDR